MTDYGLVYGSCRERIVELVRALPPDAITTVVPACPAWTVHDVVAHLAGEVTDVNRGNLEGVGSEAWTAAQIDSRRGASVGELLDEWATESPAFEDGLRAIGGLLANAAIADVWNHEQDIRGAISAKGGHDPTAELIALDGYTQLKASAFAAAGLPPLRLIAGTHTVQTAEGQPVASVTAEPFELARAVCARRTAEQLREYHWEGDCSPFIAALAEGAPSVPIPF